jgi:acyl-CoA synthetase (AMP-forming)/AMP-acid ligase II
MDLNEAIISIASIDLFYANLKDSMESDTCSSCITGRFCAAVGIPDEEYGEEIMCCCVLKPDCSCTEEELMEHCMEHLGKFKTPKVIKVMQDLPKGPSGKIQRLKLRELEE